MRLNELGQFFTKVIVFNSILNAPKHPQTKQLQQEQAQGLLKAQTQNAAVKLLKADIKQAQADIQQLANKETVQYLKDALQLPQNFSGLMKQLAHLSTQRGQNLTPEMLKTFFDSAAKKALSKLSKDIKEISKQGYKNDLLTDVLKVATNLLPTNETQPTQMMKTLTLLYLPWLPLGENIDFEMYFGDTKEGAQGGENEATITVVIQTIHYGLIKLFLMPDIDNPTKILIKISCPAEFPKNELENDIKQNKSKTEGNMKISYEQIKLQKMPPESAKQKVDFQTQTKINPKIMNVAFKLIKQIIEIDKRTELHHKREQMLPDEN